MTSYILPRNHNSNPSSLTRDCAVLTLLTTVTAMASSSHELDALPAADQGAQSGGARLFSGIKLWFSYTVPQRPWLMENARLNGAEIVPLEKQADILLVDHARKNQAPGTTSYRFIERSIRKGELEDLQDHAVGATTRAARPVGSVTTASKGGRNPYTEVEDQFLWDMVQPVKQRGGPWQGNELYKQIEQINPKHPFQSWRDRFIKYVQFQNRQTTENAAQQGAPSRSARPVVVIPRRTARQESPVDKVAEQVEEAEEDQQQHHTESRPSPKRSSKKRSHEQMQERENSKSSMDIPLPQTPNEVTNDNPRSSPIVTPLSQRTPQSPEKPPQRPKSPVDFQQPLPWGFTAHEAKKLYKGTVLIVSVDPKTWNDSWRRMAKSDKDKGHTAQEWKSFWESIILPEYCKRRGKAVEEVVDLNHLGREIVEHDDQAAEDESDGDEESKEGAEGGEIVKQASTVKPDRASEMAESEAVQKGAVSRGKGKHIEVQGYDKADLQRQVEREQSEAPSSPGAISCTKCFTTESRKWRRDKQGNLLCDDCGRFLKSSGLRPSMALTEVEEEQEGAETEHQRLPEASLPLQRQIGPQSDATQPPVITATPSRTDAGVQTSPIIPSATPDRRRDKSLSFEPDTPSVNRPPEPNEARKRTPNPSSKSNSQETNKSSHSQQEGMATAGPLDRITGDDGERKPKQVRVRSPETLEAATTRSRKKPRIQDEPHILEIPPTPEHLQDVAGDFDLDTANGQRSLTSPSPQPFKFTALKSSTPHSPLFVPEESDDEEEVPSPAFEGVGASPLRVNLVTDVSSQHQETQDDALSEADTASQYGFDDGHEESQDWETAPEPEEGMTQRYETAPEDVIGQQTKSKPRVETQVLFDITTQNGSQLGDYLDVPAPLGGWGDEAQDQDQKQDGHVEIDDSLPDLEDLVNGRAGPIVEIESDEDADSKEDEDEGSPVFDKYDDWRPYLSTIYPPHTLTGSIDLDDIAYSAIYATSWDFALATTAVDHMVASLRHQSATAPRHILQEQRGLEARIPDDIRGCWTELDDRMLLGPRTADWDRAARKHGKDECKRRFDFLAMWNKTS
jgi:TRF2-interacting telomeric protein/Rap1 - C terminal domain/Rap1 Myb domain/GATA zinc finger